MKLSDLFTENDGATACPARIVALSGALVFFGLTVYNAVQNGTADLLEYAQSLGLVILAVGGTVAGKSAVEKIKDAS